MKRYARDALKDELMSFLDDLKPPIEDHSKNKRDVSEDTDGVNAALRLVHEVPWCREPSRLFLLRLPLEDEDPLITQVSMPGKRPPRFDIHEAAVGGGDTWSTFEM